MIINDLRAKVRKEVLPSVEHLPELLHGAGDDAGDGEGKTKVERSSLVAGQLVGHRPLLVEGEDAVMLQNKGIFVFSATSSSLQAGSTFRSLYGISLVTILGLCGCVGCG